MSGQLAALTTMTAVRRRHRGARGHEGDWTQDKRTIDASTMSYIRREKARASGGRSIRSRCEHRLERVRTLEKETNQIIPGLVIPLSGLHRGRASARQSARWGRRRATRRVWRAARATTAVVDRYHSVSPGDLEDVEARGQRIDDTKPHSRLSPLAPTRHPGAPTLSPQVQYIQPQASEVRLDRFTVFDEDSPRHDSNKIASPRCGLLYRGYLRESDRDSSTTSPRSPPPAIHPMRFCT